jgi:hypothetical protein
VSSEFKGFKLLAELISSHRQMTDAKAAGICWEEEELTVVVVVVVAVVVPAEIKRTSSWCTKLLRPEAWTKEKKQDKGDHQSENYHKLVSQSPVKATAAIGELQVPDPHVTAAPYGNQSISLSLETFRADHLEILLLLLLLHSKTNYAPSSTMLCFPSPDQYCTRTQKNRFVCCFFFFFFFFFFSHWVQLVY